ncbi:acyltransferase family protein [Spirosoma jeollabukense]
MERIFKINNFDLIRIFAATQVLVFHTIDHLHLEKSIWLTPLDYFPGVPIFYAISGYLISASYERSTSLKNYFRNRLLRIYPGLWVCLLLTVLVASLFGFNFINKSAPVWLISQMAGLIYTPGFLADFGFGSYNGSLWTIFIELQFYIVLPIAYLVMSKGKSSNTTLYILFSLFVIIALATKLFLPGILTDHESILEKVVRYSFFPHFYVFLAGVIMQRLKIYKSNLIYGKGLYWIVAYACFNALISLSSISALSILSILLLSVCIISLAYTRTELAHKLLGGNDISYGVYIYHGLLLNILVSFNLFSQHFYIAIVLIGAYLLGYFSWILIEKPFLRRKAHIPYNQLTTSPLIEPSISKSGASV